jgi:UDP-GlcNAc:undecaprenyl-phosphate GlcNAc-1-phosphate transferase
VILTAFLSMIVTALIVVIVIPLLRYPAHLAGLVDRPGGRKDHGGEVPLTGGAAILGAFVIVAVWFWGAQGVNPHLVVALGSLLLMGTLDDRFHLAAPIRLGLQVLVAIFVVGIGGITISHLGTFPGTGKIELGWLEIPFTVLCLVGLINAINMADGVDGLAGGMVAVMLSGLIVLAGMLGLWHWTLPVVGLLAAIIGFLVWNFPGFGARPAQVFLGDAGSMMLGLALGWFAIELAQVQRVHVPPIVFAWILAVPVFETVVVMIRRVLHGFSPLHPDREHLHHHLIRIGVSKRLVTTLIVAMSLVGVAIGILGWVLSVPQWLLFALFMAAGFGHLAAMEFWLSRRPDADAALRAKVC